MMIVWKLLAVCGKYWLLASGVGRWWFRNVDPANVETKKTCLMMYWASFTPSVWRNYISTPKGKNDDFIL